MEYYGIDKFRQARAQLLFTSIFWGSLSLKLRIVEMSHEELVRLTDGRTRIAATDGEAIYYSRQWIDNASLAEIKFVIAHECMHCLLEHWYRQEKRDQGKWDMACDYAINGVLRNETKHLSMPHNCLFNASLMGKSAEEIYTLMRNQPGAYAPKEGINWNVGAVIQLRDKANPHVQAGEAQTIRIRNEWKIEAQRALEMARKVGMLPAGLDRMIQESANPDRDLEDELREFVVSTTEGDYTMFPCSRLFIPYGLYLPTTRGLSAPLMDFICDTSGSVDDRQVGIFEAKLNSVLFELNADVRLWYCDTKAYVGGRYTKHDLPIKLKPKGGGGTDYRDVFKQIEKTGELPVCAIYLTDLYCCDFPKPPPYPVLWGWICQDNVRKRPEEIAWANKVPFGKVVFVKEEVNGYEKIHAR